MRYAAFSVLVFAFSLMACKAQAAGCQCPEKPAGPGGGVTCEKEQIATCDPSGGVCTCTCDSAPKGKTRNEYIALVLSRAFSQPVRTEDFPKYSEAISAFDKVPGNGKLQLRRQPGERTFVYVGLPDSLAEYFNSTGPQLQPR
jgi:hypothetical protein